MSGKQYIIYMATNQRNGKRYVGATSRGLQMRKAHHLSDSKRPNAGCRVFNAAIVKYGFGAFEWSIISVVASWDALMDEEIRLIAELKPEYNITKGGRGLIGVKQTPESIAKMIRTLKSKPTPMAVLDALRRGQKNIKKRVILVESGEIFDSIALAARKYKLGEKHLYECIERGHTCQGFTFRKIDTNGFPVVIPPLKSARRVICVDDMIVSTGILDASTRYGINRAKLTEYLSNGAVGCISGLQLAFLDEWCGNAA